MTYDATASLSYTFDQENRLTGAGGYTYTTTVMETACASQMETLLETARSTGR